LAPDVDDRQPAAKLAAEDSALADSLVRKLDELRQVRYELYLLELRKNREK
jgi:hypothetical protein